MFTTKKEYLILIGTILNLNKGRSGRKPSALTVPKLQMLQDLLDGISK